MTDFDVNDPQNIWVAPDSYTGGDDASVSGIGTYDDPHVLFADALKKASPGRRVILLPGVYGGNQTIDISGEEKSPIYITAHKPEETTVENGCWYFYDTSDLVVSGLTFKNSPRGAVSVIGQCRRNRFHNMRFVECGADGKASGTFYFGGAGGQFNIVEDCEFTRAVERGGAAQNKQPDEIIVALMVSDGADGDYLKNHIIRRNNFSGYDKAIILGSGSAPDFESGHVVERNKIGGCLFDGITAACGDVQIRRNAIEKCRLHAIAIIGGRDATISENRISECGNGISIGGMGAMIVRNHIVKCQSSAVSAMEHGPPAQNLVVHRNQIVDCGAEDGAIIINQNTSGVIVKNTFYGTQPAYIIHEFMKKYIAASDNIEGANINEYADERADAEIDTRGYVEASMPDEDGGAGEGIDYDDGDSGDDIDEDGDNLDDGDSDEDSDNLDGGDERNEVLNYMFNNVSE